MFDPSRAKPGGNAFDIDVCRTRVWSSLSELEESEGERTRSECRRFGLFIVGGVICAACIAKDGIEAECGIAGLASTLGMMLSLS